MANATTVETSYTQENTQDDECRENIPAGITATPGNPKLKIQVKDIEGCSSIQQMGEFETCTFSTPAPTNNNVKARSRLSGLQSALTPILKYLNIGNKGLSPETMTQGSSPHPTGLSFCKKTTGALSQRSNADCSRRSPSDTDVCWLADECLPEITLLDVTCDTTMQLAKNDSALPDSLPSTPVTARLARTSVTPKPPATLSTTPQTGPLKNTQSIQSHLHPVVRCPQKESEAAENTTAVSKNSTETSLVINHSLEAEKGGLCGVQDATFDKDSLQKSSETGASTICPQNNTFRSNPSKMDNTITVSDTSSHDSHHSSWEKLSSSEICNAEDSRSHAELTGMSKYDSITASKDPNAKMSDFPDSIDAPLRWLDDRYFPEITLLDVTCDTVFSPRNKTAPIEVTQNNLSVENLQDKSLSSAQSEAVAVEPGTSNFIQSENLSSTVDGSVTNPLNSCSEQSDKCEGENIPKTSLETTRDISMESVLEDSRPSLESSGQTLAKTQASVEEAVCDNPANVTHDISSSSSMSISSCAASQSAPLNTLCSTSSKNATFELHEPVTSSNSVNASNEDQPQSHEADMSRKEPQSNSKAPESANSTFTVSDQSESTNANTTTPMPHPQNNTLELSPSSTNSPRVDKNTKDEPTSACKKTTETPPVIDRNCSSVKPGDQCDVQNVTFDRHSLQKSTSSTVLGEATATTFNLQNNTFNIKSSKQNATITMSERSSSDSQQSTLDKPSPPKGCNATPKDNNSEVHMTTKNCGTTGSADSEAKTVCTPESTFESHPAPYAASELAHRETKDHSETDLPQKHSVSDNLGHQSMDVEENRGNTFNLDDTLDLRADSLITSTPMVNSKMFNFHTEREEGKVMGAQKKLYRDPPSKPDSEMPSDVPPNIVCNRKTFLTQPAAKSLLPPLRAASQLLHNKPVSALPGRLEPLMSGLPMTRQRSQVEALRTTTASDASQVVLFFSFFFFEVP